MRIPEESNKHNFLVFTCVCLVVGLFFVLQKYENVHFQREITPKLFSQNSTVKLSSDRQMASVEE